MMKEHIYYSERTSPAYTEHAMSRASGCQVQKFKTSPQSPLLSLKDEIYTDTLHDMMIYDDRASSGGAFAAASSEE